MDPYNPYAMDWRVWLTVIIIFLGLSLAASMYIISGNEGLIDDQFNQIQDLSQQRDQLQQDLDDCRDKIHFYGPEENNSPDSNGEEFTPPGLPDMDSV